MQDGSVNTMTVKAALADFKDPETGRGVVEMDQVHDCQVDAGRIHVTLGLTTHSSPLWSETREAVLGKLRTAFPDVPAIDVEVEKHLRRPQKLGEIGLTAKSVIVVGSGKGGVGKSTIAAALAYGLNRAWLPSRTCRCRCVWSECSALARCRRTPGSC